MEIFLNAWEFPAVAAVIWHSVFYLLCRTLSVDRRYHSDIIYGYNLSQTKSDIFYMASWFDMHVK